MGCCGSKNKDSKGVREVHSKAEYEANHVTGRLHRRAVVVAFVGPWCDSSRALQVPYQSLVKRYDDAMFLRVDVKALQEVAQECGVDSTPTFQVWRNDELVEALVAPTPDELRRWLDKHLTVA